MSTEPQNENNTPSYYIDEGVPGVGERPAWLNEKFKTVADMAKSYTELEKKISVVPDEYDLSKSRFIDGNFEPIQDALKVAREKRVPKEVVDKFVDSIDKYMDQFDVNPEQEAKKLGDNVPQRLQELDNWLAANYSPDAVKALTKNLVTADSIKALEEIRSKQMLGKTMIPPGNDNATNNTQSLDDLKKELSDNLPKYKTDEVYRKDLGRRMEVAVKNSSYVDKTGA